MEKITNKRIEEETVILPEVIAEIVAERALDHQFEASMKSWNKLSLEQQKELDEKYRAQKAVLITYLTERAELHYQHNESFNKAIKSKRNGGNYGRDHLTMFMHHWAGMDEKGNYIAPYQSAIEKFNKYMVSQ